MSKVLKLLTEVNIRYLKTKEERIIFINRRKLVMYFTNLKLFNPFLTHFFPLGLISLCTFFLIVKML